MNRAVLSPGRLALAALALSFLPTGAFAQTTFFGDDDPRNSMASSNFARSAFQAALSSFGFDDIESHPSGSFGPTLVFGSTGITAATSSGIMVADFSDNPPNLAASGAKALLGDFSTNSDQFTLSSTVNAFGFYLIQAGDQTNVSTISLLLENTSLGSSLTVPIGTFGPGRSFDSVFFFGVITSDPFNRATILHTVADGGVDGILFDDVHVGFAVPEPGSIALLAGSATMGGLYWWRRRRLNASRR